MIYYEDDEDMDSVYEILLSNVAELTETVDPLVVAAVMVTQALSIYRTLLTGEEYDRIIDKIYDNRFNIVKFEPGTMH